MKHKVTKPVKKTNNGRFRVTFCFCLLLHSGLFTSFMWEGPTEESKQDRAH